VGRKAEDKEAKAEGGEQKGGRSEAGREDDQDPVQFSFTGQEAFDDPFPARGGEDGGDAGDGASGIDGLGGASG
ncbi:unnamed protein product, partial [Closterium sp. Naga37s-1]